MSKLRRSSRPGFIPRLGFTPRTGFTLVELLVVIIIIGILAGLITVAATAALTRAKTVKIKAEMSQIDTALRAYQQKYGSYPPDSWDFSDPASKARFVAHIQRAFPRITLTAAPNGIPVGLPNTMKMSPPEALVYWLRGFNPDPTNPLYEEAFVDANGNKKWDTGESFTDANSNSRYDGRTDTSLYTFDMGRLGSGPNGYATYIPSGVKLPYAYFNLVPLMSLSTPAAMSAAAPFYDPEPSAAPVSSKKSIAVPYFTVEPPSPPFGTPVNEEGFQIVSGGLDDDYGQVTVEGTPPNVKPKWDDKTAYKAYPAGTNYSAQDNDNLTNFNENGTLDDARP